MRQRRMSFGALVALFVLAVGLAAPAPAGAAGSSRDATARRALDAFGGRATPELSAAVLTTGTDTTGDVSACQGDIESFAADYAGSPPAVAFGVRTVCANDLNSAPWTQGYSFAGWLIDTTGDDAQDFVVFVANDGGGAYAELYRVVGQNVEPVCGGVVVTADGGRGIVAGFEASCLGSPPSFRVNAGFQFDQYAAGDPQCGTCTFDEAPNNAWGPVTTYTDPTPPPPPPPPAPGAGRQGYWMIGRTGDTYAFGAAQPKGNTPSGDVVDLEPTASGNGYWTVNAKGNVFTFGDAAYFGGAPGLPAGETVTAISRTASSQGYWLFTSRGRVLPFGNAPHLGDMSGTPLNGPVLDSIPTPTGNGYYMVGSDGGIFSFGDAAFHGSMGDVKLNAPVQSLVPDPDGTGYWLVASDGGIFAFEAEFYGSMGSTKLNKPVTGMVGFGKGYLMVGEDGGIFTFGDAPFFGSLGDNPPSQPIVSVAILNQP